MTLGSAKPKFTLRLKQKFLEELYWVWLFVGIAWVMLILLGHHHGSSEAHVLHSTHSTAHHATVLSLLLTRLFIALLSWEIMVIAMMLPSTLPTVKAFMQVSQTQGDRSRAQVMFLIAYLVVWTGFAILIWLGDVGVDYFLGRLQNWETIASPSIVGWTLIGMGVFQFTPIKQACLKGCRTGAVFVAQRYEKGWKAAWSLGVEHGLYCLGCCWALMVGLIILGMENLWYMLLFTAVMTIEKIWQHGQWFSVAIGVGLIVAGGVGVVPGLLGMTF
jgi:predicted metal-binding membrane protein